MTIRNKFVQAAVLLASMAAMAGYGWGAGRLYLAHRYATRVDNQTALQRAASLEPQDAAYENALGRYFMFAAQEPVLAVAHCRRAVDLNARDSRFWLDLAQAYFLAGAAREQEIAIRNAVAADPTTPEVAWNAANFFLLEDNVPEAFRQFRVVLQFDPGLTQAALEQSWRATRNVKRIEAILPPNPDVYLRFVQLLVNRDERPAAADVWSSLLGLNRDFDFHNALFYVDYLLLQKRDPAAAQEAWKQLAARSPALARYLAADDAIADGTFSEDILDAGFDWRYTAGKDVNVTLDTNEFHSGNRALSFLLAGAINDFGVSQYAFLQPNQRYTLSAWVKSEELQTAFGVRVLVADPFLDRIYAMTDETMGTTVWHQVNADFETGPAPRLVIIRFGRSGGESPIHGRVWFDDVSLRPFSESRASD